MGASSSRRVLRARYLPLAPQPVAIARSLVARGAAGVALLHSARAGCHGAAPRRSYVCAWPEATSQALDPLSEDAAGPADGAWAHVPRWIGVLPYEARRQLERPAWTAPDARPAPLIQQICWQRYAAVICIDHERGEVALISESDKAGQRLLQAVTHADPSPPSLAAGLNVTTADADADHLQRIDQARALIADGDLYQVNMARRLDVRLVSGTPLDAYAHMLSRAPAAYAAYLELPRQRYVLSTSPELLLRADPSATAAAAGWRGYAQLHSEPIKGSRPRGHDAASDRRLRRALAADPKERAELAMIVDVVRNDLGSVSTIGSVRIAQAAHVRSMPSIHHRMARVVSQARPDASREEVIAAMLPSGSVTGAPKIRAMEVIAELESSRRGLYTGALGYVAQDGGLTLAMAIRTLVLQQSASATQGHYWTGGGIVLRSDPQRELHETQWKAVQLAARETQRKAVQLAARDQPPP